MTSIFNDEVCKHAVRAAYARKYPQWFFNDATEEDWCRLAEVENCKEKLRATIRTKLANFPHVEKYYRDLIERRITLPCPLENSLVLLLCDGGLEKLDQRLSSVEIREPQLLERIFDEPSGNYTGDTKKEMDDRIENAWAEVMAAYVLLYHVGFQHLQKPSQGQDKSSALVDFEGVHCVRGEYLVEVTRWNYDRWQGDLPRDTAPGSCNGKEAALAAKVVKKFSNTLYRKAKQLNGFASEQAGKEKLNHLLIIVTSGYALSDCIHILNKEAVGKLTREQVIGNIGVQEVLLIFDTGPTYAYLNVPSRAG